MVSVPPAVSERPVTDSVPVLVRLISPLVVFVALKVLTVLAPPSVVPVTELVVRVLVVPRAPDPDSVMAAVVASRVIPFVAESVPEVMPIVPAETESAAVPVVSEKAPPSVTVPSGALGAPTVKPTVRSGRSLVVRVSVALPRLMVSEFVGAAKRVVSNPVPPVLAISKIPPPKSLRAAEVPPVGKLMMKLADVEPPTSTGARPAYVMVLVSVPVPVTSKTRLPVWPPLMGGV